MSIYTAEEDETLRGYRRAIRNVTGLDIWVDDSKPAPVEGMAVARTYDDAVNLLRRYQYGTLFLDYDLGDAGGRNGLNLLRQLKAEGICPPKMECISWNPVGRQNILNEWTAPPGASGPGGGT